MSSIALLGIFFYPLLCVAKKAQVNCRKFVNFGALFHAEFLKGDIDGIRLHNKLLNDAGFMPYDARLSSIAAEKFCLHIGNGAVV